VSPGTQNRRSHGRIQVEAVGCMRHPVRGNEVVVVRELARGGLSFYSATKYPEGSRVEIAVPYSSKAPNIYSPARIVSSRNGAGKGLLNMNMGPPIWSDWQLGTAHFEIASAGLEPAASPQ
jgi:hypothetical protein